MAGGLEDGAEVERGNPQTLQVVQALLDPRQSAAVEVAAGVVPLVLGQGQGVLPVLAELPAAHQAVKVRQEAGPAEAIRENLVGHAAAKPIRRGQGVVVDRLLPGEAVPVQKEGAAVLPGEAEGVPEEIRLGGGGVGDGEKGAVPGNTGGNHGKLPALSGKLQMQQERGGDKALRQIRAEGEGNICRAGDRPEGRFAEGVAGVEGKCFHRQSLSLRK